MPDPLLTSRDLETAFERARTIADRYKATLSRKESFVFFEYRDTTGRQLLARIDCEGYPLQPPDVAFLDPRVGKRIAAPASTNLAHWPKGHAPLQRNGRVGLCLTGTRTYRLAHADTGPIMPLSQLVVTLVMCCQGRARQLLARARRRRHA